MNKKIYRYGVRFPIRTTAFITLTRKEKDIPVKDLIFSISQDELLACEDWDDLQHERINIYEDAKWMLEQFKNHYFKINELDTSITDIQEDDFEILEVEEDEASDSEIMEMLQDKLHKLQLKQNFQRTSSTREENE